jgi:putative dGTPase
MKTEQYNKKYITRTNLFTGKGMIMRDKHPNPITEKLFTEKRFKENNNDDFAATPTYEVVSLTPFEEDYSAYISTSVVRALQNKTQVFTEDSSDFTRTRLTHSLEVSSIGIRIAKSLCADKSPYFTKIPEEDREFIKEHENDISSILSTAGLLHDIGNPPFGHAGEEVLREWIADWLGENNTLIIDEDLINDLRNVEGNAQTIRYLLSEVSPIESEINPTYAVVSTLMKYTICASKFKNKSEEQPKVEMHKPGFYHSEKDAIDTIVEEIGLSDDEHDIPLRNPLAFLLEAADDIAYATADFEDALYKDMISIKDLKEREKIQNSVKKQIQPGQKAKQFEDINFNQLIKKLESCSSKDERLNVTHSWIEEMRKRLIYVAVFEFNNNYSKILEGKFHDELLLAPDSFLNYFLLMLKEYVHQYVHDSNLIKNQKDIAENSLRPILNYLTSFIVNDGLTKVESLNQCPLIPVQLKARLEKVDNDHPEQVIYKKMRIVLDFVCLLTDSSAITLGNVIKNYF